MAYTLSFLANLQDGLDRQPHLDLEGKNFQILDWDENKNSATAIVEGPVNRDGLSIQTGPQPLDGSEPSKGISVPEKSAFNYFLRRVVHLLSFLTLTPIRSSRNLIGDSLIPETPDDERFLEGFETRRLHVALQGRLTIQAPLIGYATDHTCESLLRKEIGLALYAQALLIQEPIAVFRELWKLLESAFGAKNKALIGCLANFVPAQQIRFTEKELKELLKLRGRASHAESRSRSGIKELESVSAEVSRRLPRLRSLAEQVLLTKKTWGVQTLQTERLAPLVAYTGPDDTPDENNE